MLISQSNKKEGKGIRRWGDTLEKSRTGTSRRRHLKLRRGDCCLSLGRVEKKRQMSSFSCTNPDGTGLPKSRKGYTKEAVTKKRLREKKGKNTGKRDEGVQSDSAFLYAVNTISKGKTG